MSEGHRSDTAVDLPEQNELPTAMIELVSVAPVEGQSSFESCTPFPKSNFERKQLMSLFAHPNDGALPNMLLVPVFWNCPRIK